MYSGRSRESRLHKRKVGELIKLGVLMDNNKGTTSISKPNSPAETIAQLGASLLDLHICALLANTTET